MPGPHRACSRQLHNHQTHGSQPDPQSARQRLSAKRPAKTLCAFGARSPPGTTSSSQASSMPADPFTRLPWFDYQPGWNLHMRPRQDEQVTFETLRALADSYDLLRLVIETRKDQIAKLSWSVQPRKRTGTSDRAPSDNRVKEVTRLLRRPDGVNSWQNW